MENNKKNEGIFQKWWLKMCNQAPLYTNIFMTITISFCFILTIISLLLVLLLIVTPGEKIIEMSDVLLPLLNIIKITCEFFICYSVAVIIIMAVRRKYYKFFILSPALITKKKVCINQKLNSTCEGCPQEQFKEELKKIINEIPEGVTYHATTHGRLISLIKKMPAYTEDRILLQQSDSIYQRDLKTIERMLWSKQCESCGKEDCRIFQAKNNKKEKSIEDFYAVHITKKSN